MSNIVLITGGFDPLHSGHIELISAAKEIGRVAIGLNSDDWLTRKKGAPFLTFSERKNILSNLKNVMMVFGFDDADNTACNAIEYVKTLFPKENIIFANGGDRDTNNTPEEEHYKNDQQVNFVYGVGGTNKKNSSSWILSNWISNNFENRLWGTFKTIYTNGNVLKIKELFLEPTKSISLQRHKKRGEFWVVIDGECFVEYGYDLNVLYKVKFEKSSYIHIDKGMMHRITNSSNNKTLKILEVQHGELCDESDIERFL